MYPFKNQQDSSLSDEEAGELYRLRQIKNREKQVVSLVGGAKKCNVAGVLKKFHHDALTEGRLSLLEKMSTVGVKPVSFEELKNRRRNFNSVKNTKFPLKDTDICWCCNLGQATVRHHILLLMHGGPVTSKQNIVLLCKDCHNKVHPWLHSTEGIQKSKETILYVNHFLRLLDDISGGKCARKEAEQRVMEIISSLFSTTCKN